MKSLQKFASVHANVHNHFNQERHLVWACPDNREFDLQNRAVLRFSGVRTVP